MMAQDQDETITKFERLAEAHEDEIAELFKKIDVDGNGSLSREELRDIIKEYGTPHGNVPFDEDVLMRFYDQYGREDGEIQLNEFRWYLADWACAYADGDEAGAAKWMPEVIMEVASVQTAAQEVRRKAALSEVFKLIDNDGDGQVTPSDCKKVVEAGKVASDSWTSSWLADAAEEPLALRAWLKLMIKHGEAMTEMEWLDSVTEYKAAWVAMGSVSTEAAGGAEPVASEPAAPAAPEDLAAEAEAEPEPAVDAAAVPAVAEAEAPAGAA